MDWLTSTTGQRRTLYASLKRVADRNNKPVEQLCAQILKENLSIEYIKTLRAGRYSKKKALQFYSWLEEHHHADAEALQNEAAAVDDRQPGARWTQFMNAHAKADGLAIIKRAGLAIVGLTRNRPTQKIKLEEDFYLVLDSPFCGFVGGLQLYGGRWFGLLLQSQEFIAPIRQEQMVLPRRPDCDGIDYLSEAEDTGPHQFVLIAAPLIDGFAILSEMPTGKEISLTKLDNLADALDQGFDQVTVFRASFSVTATG